MNIWQDYLVAAAMGGAAIGGGIALVASMVRARQARRETDTRHLIRRGLNEYWDVTTVNLGKTSGSGVEPHIESYKRHFVDNAIVLISTNGLNVLHWDEKLKSFLNAVTLIEVKAQFDEAYTGMVWESYSPIPSDGTGLFTPQNLEAATATETVCKGEGTLYRRVSGRFLVPVGPPGKRIFDLESVPPPLPRPHM